ncbi:MAG: beta-galactosidase [Proteobacteria bacterium]|nr:beta-galactosidase [Pseudomonadota bacterium]
MEARRTWFDAAGLKIAGEAGEISVPIYAGQLAYWRTPAASWPAALRQLRALGLTLVSTFVPWRVHEVAAGTFTWTGDRDLARFLTSAQAAGLGVILRPGPRVDDELPCFGFPDHVLAEPAVQARTTRGTPVWMPSPPRAWPIPSYASPAFHAHVRRWFAEVARVVGPHLAPTGAVVALEVDHHANRFYRTGATDRLATGDGDGSDDEPAALARFATMLDEVGLGGIARFHGAPPIHFGHHEACAIQRAIGGPVGIAAHAARAELPELGRRARATTGKATPLPFASDVQLGVMPWLPPRDGGRDQLLTLLAAGIRGWNLVGELEASAGWIGKLVAALVEIDWPSLRRRAPIALVDTRADLRFGLATSVLDPIAPIVAEALGLGPAGAAELGTDPGAIAARRWQTAIARALELAQVGYDIVDEAADDATLASYRAVIVPTQERVDRALWHRIRALAEARRCVVVIGPGTPSRDEHDRALDDATPIRRLGRIRAGSLDDLPGLANDLAGLASADELWHVERPETVRISALFDREEVARAVIASSEAGAPVTAIVRAVGRALRDPLTGEQLAITGGRASIALPAGGVRFFVVER